MIAFRTRPARAMLLAALVLSPVLLAACIGAERDDRLAVGRLDLPLQSSSSEGTLFRLGGTFDLVGPEDQSAVVDPSDSSASDDVLTLRSPSGSYTLTLSDWTLYEVDATTSPPGLTPRPDALLSSPVTRSIDILNSETTEVSYQFFVPGSGTIDFARGTLDIDIAVGEGFTDGAPCAEAVECRSRVCASGHCQAATCSDGVRNGSEAGPDCGSFCGNVCASEMPCPGGCPADASCVDTNGDGAGDECSATCIPAYCAEFQDGICVDTNDNGIGDWCLYSANCAMNECLGTPYCTDSNNNGIGDRCTW